MTTPTDGEWMSAKEDDGISSLSWNVPLRGQKDDLRPRPRRDWLGHAPSGLLLGASGLMTKEVPPELWAERFPPKNGRLATSATPYDYVHSIKAFGVEFRRSDIEQLSPATTAKGTSVLIPVELESPPEVPSLLERFSSFMVAMRMQRMRSLYSLKKIRLEDVVLHQRPNRGRNLLTKFQEETEGASFAVILMTPPTMTVDLPMDLSRRGPGKMLRRLRTRLLHRQVGDFCVLRLSSFLAWRSHPISTEFAG